MKKFKLQNGLTVILVNRPSKTFAIEVNVGIGSNYESDKIRGISHFIEHMLFEGTKKRTSFQIANEIESVGGEIGAFTSNVRTCFYIKAIKKHYKKSFDVLLDILTSPAFDDKMIEKERKVILSEVKMREDEPRYYQWQLLQTTMFKDYPAKHPIIGYRETIQKMSREDIISYFKKNYNASNMILTYVGDTKGVLNDLKSYFSKIPSGKKAKVVLNKEKRPKKNSSKKVIRDISQAYMVRGFLSVPRFHKDSYVLDVIHALLGRGLSGKLFDEIRQKHGLAYDVGSHNEAEKDYGFYAVYVNTDKKNLIKAKDLIKKVFSELNDLTPKELKEAKTYIEGDFIMEEEDNQKFADEIAFWENTGDSSMIKSYLKNIKKVTKKDILRVRDKYLYGPCTEIVISKK